MFMGVVAPLYLVYIDEGRGKREIPQQCFVWFCLGAFRAWDGDPGLRPHNAPRTTNVHRKGMQSSVWAQIGAQQLR